MTACFDIWRRSRPRLGCGRPTSVRITLVDGTVVTTNGINPTVAQPGGWGIIEGLGADQGSAVVVRESGVVKVEFALTTYVPPPIGFGTEAAGP